MYPLMLFAFIGYLIGAIPFGFILGKIFLKTDVRKIGSKSIGATNVLRLGNKWVALAAMVLDIAKVYIAWLVVQTLIYKMYGYFASAILIGMYGLQLKMIVAAAALIGHCFPIYVGFKGGGKGVSCFGGLLILLYPLLFVYAFATWLLLLVVIKISSLAALITGALLPLYVTLFAKLPSADKAIFTWYVIALVLFVVLRHAGNIRRLIKGEEDKVKLGKKK